MKYDSWVDSDENRVLTAISARKLIRNIGIAGIVWGLISIGIGILFARSSPLNMVPLLLGVFMLGTGVWAMTRPSLGVLLTETIVALLFVLWYVIMWFLLLLVFGLVILVDVIGLGLLVVGLGMAGNYALGVAGNYRRLRHLREPIASVAPERIAAAKEVCRTLVKKKPKDEPLIVVTTDGMCRVQLMENQAFFIQRDLLRAFVAPREAVCLAVAEPSARTWIMSFRHPMGRAKYKFDRKNSEKMRAWLAAEPEAAAA